MSKIQQVLTSGDINGNRVVPSGDGVATSAARASEIGGIPLEKATQVGATECTGENSTGQSEAVSAVDEAVRVLESAKKCIGLN